MRFEFTPKFFLNFWMTWVLFVGSLIPPFGTSGHVLSGFQSQSGQPYLCSVEVTCYQRFTLVWMTPADLLAAEPFSSMYLQAGICAAWNWDLSCHFSQCGNSGMLYWLNYASSFTKFICQAGCHLVMTDGTTLSSHWYQMVPHSAHGYQMVPHWPATGTIWHLTVLPLVPDSTTLLPLVPVFTPLVGVGFRLRGSCPLSLPSPCIKHGSTSRKYVWAHLKLAMLWIVQEVQPFTFNASFIVDFCSVLLVCVAQ